MAQSTNKQPISNNRTCDPASPAIRLYRTMQVTAIAVTTAYAKAIRLFSRFVIGSRFEPITTYILLLEHVHGAAYVGRDRAAQFQPVGPNEVAAYKSNQRRRQSRYAQLHRNVIALIG